MKIGKTSVAFVQPPEMCIRDSFHAENIRIGNGEIFFDYVSPLGNIPNIQLGVPVSINIENGVAAMALSLIHISVH